MARSPYRRRYIGYGRRWGRWGRALHQLQRRPRANGAARHARRFAAAAAAVFARTLLNRMARDAANLVYDPFGASAANQKKTYKNKKYEKKPRHMKYHQRGIRNNR